MSKLLELSEADRAFKESMIKLNSIKSTLDILDKEIYLLTNEKVKLDENVEYLHLNGIVIIAKEYRKIKQELYVINSKLFLLGKDRESVSKAYSEADMYMNKMKENYEKIKKGVENNVIKFEFRK